VPGLIVGMGVFLIGVGTGIIDFLDDWWDVPGYSWPYVWYFTLISFAAWGWLVAMLSFGTRPRAFQRPLPIPLAQAAMPFFLVHQPVILAIAYYVVGWDASIAAKYAALLPTAFAVSALLAWLISVIPGLSLLFGVKRRTASALNQQR
jgi:glucan biosynthesis protein C